MQVGYNCTFKNVFKHILLIKLYFLLKLGIYHLSYLATKPDVLNMQMWYVCENLWLNIINIIWAHQFPFAPWLQTSLHTSLHRKSSIIALCHAHQDPKIAHFMLKIIISFTRTQVLLCKDRKHPSIVWQEGIWQGTTVCNNRGIGVQ